MHGLHRLAQLNADVAKENVRNRAAAEFEKQPEDKFVKELCRVQILMRIACK